MSILGNALVEAILTSYLRQGRVNEILGGDTVDKINSDWRTILNLRILKGFSVDETAAIMGKTREEVEIGQYQALYSLAQTMDQPENII